MRQRLLTDTCSVFMLLAVGIKLFQKGVLRRGDLIIHPQVWAETKKWPKKTKLKYEAELKILHKDLSFATCAKVPTSEIGRYLKLIEILESTSGYSIGYSDKVQLASVLHENDLDLVTNDGPLQKVAESFEKTVFNAEQILLEALADGVISQTEASSAMSRWELNGEPVKASNRAAIRRARIKPK